MNQEQDFYDSQSVTAHGLLSFQSISNTTTLQDEYFSLPNQSDDPLVGNSSAMGVGQLPVEQMSYYIDETPSNTNTNNNSWDSNIEVVLQDQKLLPSHVEELPCMNSAPSSNIFSIHPSCPPAPDLLNLLHLPAPVLPPPCSIMDREPPLQLKFCPRPPVFGHDQYFHSLACRDNFGVGGATSTLFSGGGGVLEEMEGGRGVLQEMGGEHPMLGLRREMEAYGGKGDGRAEYTTEKQRRDLLKKQFGSLMSLVPNPSKTDRASIVQDAIEYIQELLRTVEELKLLVEKKRCNGMDHRSKRPKLQHDEQAPDGDMESSCVNPSSTVEQGDQQSFTNVSLRSSWLLRKSKDTVVDVRIIDDEVNIKLTTQRKKVSCLLLISKVLHDLQLNLLQVAGGNIGDHYIFMFNTKISEDSSLYASAIAKKMIEVIDQNSLAFPAGF